MDDQSQAIILAAGRGTRLRPLTDDTPKTLLEIDEHGILEHILQALETNGYERAVIVTGFESEQIRDHCTPRQSIDIEFVHNEDYASTNNIYSLWLAKEYALEGFTLINADTLFPPESLRQLQQRDESALLVDSEKELEDEEMQVAFGSDHIETIGKNLDGEDGSTGVYLDDGDGEYIGVSKFTAEDAALLFEHIEEFIDRGEVGEWYEAAFDELFDDREIGYVQINEPWAEVDTQEDLERARELWG
jgi:L-glutamine-phosphate cytidylyltransferase